MTQTIDNLKIETDLDDIIPEGYIRVTELLSELYNYVGVDPYVLENAKKRGTEVHRLCELYSQNIFINENEEYRGYVNSFKNWFNTYVSSVYITEERINHHEYKITGKIDALIYIKGDNALTLLDIKTSKFHHGGWPLQTAAYKLLFEQCKKIPIARRIVLQLDKEGGKAHIHEYLDHKKDEKKFLHALWQYRISRNEDHFFKIPL